MNEKLQEIKELRKHHETTLILTFWKNNVDWLIQTIEQQQEKIRQFTMKYENTGSMMNVQNLRMIIKEKEMQNETLTEQLDISQSLHQKEFNNAERYKKALKKIVDHSGMNKQIDLELWRYAKKVLEGEANE